MNEQIEDTLKKIGLSEKEIEIFTLLAKKGAQKGTDITKQLKIHRGQVYRILKGLEKKAIVETTLENPKRFVAVPLERIIDSFIKSKRKEVDQIEETKEDLISNWKKIQQLDLDSSLEKFSVIEGRKNIFYKISQMFDETKKIFSGALSISDLLKIEQIGIFDAYLNQQNEQKASVRLLTHPFKEDVNKIKFLQKSFSNGINFRARNAELGISFLPRLIVQDSKEILLFISDPNIISNSNKQDICLHTNSKCIVQSFLGVFNDCWQKSSSINEKLIEIETGKSSPTMDIIKDPKNAKKLYYDKLNSANKEIMIVVSDKRLNGFIKNSRIFEDLFARGISIKIMAPITCENLKFAQKLLKFAEVRHIPVGYRETTIIDENYLFQFNISDIQNNRDIEILNFENVFFTNNSEYIRQTKDNLLDVWIKTRSPSNITLKGIIRPKILPEKEVEENQIHTALQKMSTFKHMKNQTVTKETVLNKIKNLKKIPVNKLSKVKAPEVTRFFGAGGAAIIHPTPMFNLPEFIIGAFKFNDKSSFGETNHLLVFLKTENESNSFFEPAVVIDTNQNIIDYRKIVYKGSPVQNNVKHIRDDELQIQIQGNTLFAGWTVPIPLLYGEYVLPPSCILFEGYGEIKSGHFKNILPSGRKQDLYYNCLDSFVTYFHPSMKYICPGTEGFFDRESVFTSNY